VNCLVYFSQVQFAAFDLMFAGNWQDAEHASLGHQLPWVPRLTPEPIPYDFERICEMAEGLTTVPGAKPGTIREGLVVSPLRERVDGRVGRVKMKVVAAAYLERYR
jgi:hypothetical protein